MESYGLEMDELFDDGDVTQEIEAFETITEPNNADIENEGLNTTNNEDGNISQQVAEKLRQLGTGAAKKRVMRPQPKLDPTRLTGERGIPLLPQLFKDVKYKGKGHEVSDLNKMMSMMEHWSHRLFPKMPFDELIERVERLGQKRAVQTCVSKIRLDMPILDDDFVRQVSDDEDATAAAGDNNTLNEDVERQLFGDPDVPDIADEDEEALDEMLQEEAANSQSIVLSASTPHPKAKPSSQPSSSGLTEEQLEKIRLNQERARVKRLNKSALNSTTTDEQMQVSLPGETSFPGETSISEENNIMDVSHTPSEHPVSDNTIDINVTPGCDKTHTSVIEDDNITVVSEHGRAVITSPPPVTDDFGLLEREDIHDNHSS